MSEELGEPVADWRLHDLRRTLASGLAGLGVRSEIIKRVAFLCGLIDDPTLKVLEKAPEEELAEAIRKTEEEAARQAARNHTSGAKSA